jgi:hypothetical protein
LVIALCEQYHYTPRQCRELTILQAMRLLSARRDGDDVTSAAEATEQRIRFRRMSAEVKEKALRYKGKYGSF